MWMEKRPVWHRVRALLALFGLGAAVAACNEDLTAGSACPVLCPGQGVVVRDTLLDAVVFDTVVGGIPSLGQEDGLLLSSRGDTLDSRVVFRFDTLQTRVTRNGGDSAITAIDSAYLLLRVNTAVSRISAAARIDLYDVDTTAADTATAAIATLFRPDRLLGGSTIDTGQVKDSLRVYFTNAKLLAKITGGRRLRVGLKVSSARSATFLLGSLNVGQPALLKYDPVPSDTAIKETTVGLRSTTPTTSLELQNDLSDFLVVAKAPPQGPSTLFSIGGLPSRRTFLRFDVPARILDSSTVLRATLLLTQYKSTFLSVRDSTLLLPQVVTAGEEVTDFARAAALLSVFPVDTLRVAATDSTVRQLEVVAALRSWSVANNPFRQQRALVIRSANEGTSVAEAQFYSLRAPSALRPKMRVSYALRTTFGIP